MANKLNASETKVLAKLDKQLAYVQQRRVDFKEGRILPFEVPEYLADVTNTVHYTQGLLDAVVMSVTDARKEFVLSEFEKVIDKYAVEV